MFNQIFCYFWRRLSRDYLTICFMNIFFRFVMATWVWFETTWSDYMFYFSGVASPESVTSLSMHLLCIPQFAAVNLCYCIILYVVIFYFIIFCQILILYLIPLVWNYATMHDLWLTDIIGKIRLLTFSSTLTLKISGLSLAPLVWLICTSYSLVTVVKTRKYRFGRKT